MLSLSIRGVSEMPRTHSSSWDRDQDMILSCCWIGIWGGKLCVWLCLLASLNSLGLSDLIRNSNDKICGKKADANIQVPGDSQCWQGDHEPQRSQKIREKAVKERSLLTINHCIMYTAALTPKTGKSFFFLEKIYCTSWWPWKSRTFFLLQKSLSTKSHTDTGYCRSLYLKV